MLFNPCTTCSLHSTVQVATHVALWSRNKTISQQRHISVWPHLLIPTCVSSCYYTASHWEWLIAVSFWPNGFQLTWRYAELTNRKFGSAVVRRFNALKKFTDGRTLISDQFNGVWYAGLRQRTDSLVYLISWCREISVWGVFSDQRDVRWNGNVWNHYRASHVCDNSSV